ncbi:hypothetical protein SARC_15917, partial [Sphaeroforma arctica JP610]
ALPGERPSLCTLLRKCLRKARWLIMPQISMHSWISSTLSWWTRKTNPPGLKVC